MAMGSHVQNYYLVLPELLVSKFGTEQQLSFDSPDAIVSSIAEAECMTCRREGNQQEGNSLSNFFQDHSKASTIVGLMAGGVVLFLLSRRR